MKKGYVIASAVVAAIIATAIILPRQVRRKANEKFQHDAVSQIMQWSSDKEWTYDNLAFLAGQQDQTYGPASWLSDHLIVMTNGEWIVYFQACTKSNGKLDDMFIGKASDGKWCDTTYHFCTGMKVLGHMIGQPSDIESFIEKS